MGMNLVQRVHLTIGGVLSSGEVWQCGFNFDAQGAAGVTAASLATWVNGANDKVGLAWAGGLRASASNGAALTTVKAYYYPQGATAAQFVAAAAPQAAPGVGAQTMPNQTAIVASLLSGYSGRTLRGRVYLPLLAGGLANGQLDPAQCQTLANALSSMLAGIRTLSLGGINPFPAVAANVPVIRVSVDTVPDTQRRRRNKMVAAGTGSAVVPVP